MNNKKNKDQNDEIQNIEPVKDDIKEQKTRQETKKDKEESITVTKTNDDCLEIDDEDMFKNELHNLVIKYIELVDARILIYEIENYAQNLNNIFKQSNLVDEHDNRSN